MIMISRASLIRIPGTFYYDLFYFIKPCIYQKLKENDKNNLTVSYKVAHKDMGNKRNIALSNIISMEK